MSAAEEYSLYVEAAMVACPGCNSAVGKKCVELACKNGYKDCNYAICAYWREIDQPHLERAVKARQEREQKEDSNA